MCKLFLEDQDRRKLGSDGSVYGIDCCDGPELIKLYTLNMDCFQCVNKMVFKNLFK